MNAQKQQPKLDHIDNEKMSREIDSQMRLLDTLGTRMNDRFKMETDSINNHLRDEQTSRNLDMLMEMQRENEAKAKKAMWIRLGLGVFFLGVLIFGLMRRRKKTSQQN